jgi:hypothetical protein
MVGTMWWSKILMYSIAIERKREQCRWLLLLLLAVELGGGTL